jgi:hypothetical protein
MPITETTTRTLYDRLSDCDLSELRSDGDRIDLGEGYSLALKIAPEDDPARDFLGECSGTLSDWEKSDSPRPHGFTGAAEKIARDRGFCLWWEPYREGKKVYNSPADRAYVANALEYGFSWVRLSLHGPAVDELGYSHTVRIDSASIGGVDYFADPDYVGELVADLRAELLNSWEVKRRG